jgi:hypothetical protein
MQSCEGLEIRPCRRMRGCECNFTHFYLDVIEFFDVEIFNVPINLYIVCK